MKKKWSKIQIQERQAQNCRKNNDGISIVDGRMNT